MPLDDMKRLIESASRPIHIFGNIDESELNKKWRQFSKLVHPDSYIDTEYVGIAEQLFIKLHTMYEQAKKEFSAGIYDVFDTLILYDQAEPLFELNLGTKTYKFYEHYCEGEVANIYKGTNGKEVVYLKVAIDSSDNELIDKEYEFLKKLNHQSLPVTETNLKINDLSAFIMKEIEGVTAEELMEYFPNGVPPEHAMWILERLLGVLGYLHSNYVVHGNIKPEHIIINLQTHNATLLGFSMSILEANKDDSKYMIKNDKYSSPEINSNSKVLPNADIYSVGKIVIHLLGGDIKSNGMPLHISKNIRDFIRILVDPNPITRNNDAWGLWDDLIKLRNAEYGTERFKELDLRRRR